MSSNRKAKNKTSSNAPSGLEISEEEQWRLINQSGILKQAIPRPRIEEVQEEEDTSLGDEIFNSITMIVPFSFCLLLFEILIHFQYGKKATVRELCERMLPSIPILSVFIFYTTRYKQTRRGQAFLFALSCACGTMMIWNINHANWLVNMKQCPPLATIWVYAVVQLDLGPAVVSLLAVAWWMKWKGLKFSF